MVPHPSLFLFCAAVDDLGNRGRCAQISVVDPSRLFVSPEVQLALGSLGASGRIVINGMCECDELNVASIGQDLHIDRYQIG